MPWRILFIREFRAGIDIGSINLGKAMNIDFVQKVVAVSTALQRVAPQTDVAIELGGEDAKIIYFKDGLEERMNGVCASGTGSFIDQMASLLQSDAAGLNAEAVNYQQIYPIAARCGVFAKTDIQPLINEEATKGVIKQLKKMYPWANIAAVDYNPGASEVNQLNRIKLMLSQAKKGCQRI